MMREYGWDETRSASYLETLEEIYGPIEMHPYQNIEEVNSEWREIFMGLSAPDAAGMEGIWSEQYLAVFESIYGELLPPFYNDIEVINAEWVQLFRADTALKCDCHHAA